MAETVARGVLIAAPASGSGKTVVTLGLLRHLRDTGVAAASIKVGPDFIDPAFHAAASGRPCLNLDTWAMRPQTVQALASRAGAAAEIIVGEGVMGLFDGAPGGAGSTADVARLTGWPVVLVVDAKGMGASVAALLEGFCAHRRDVPVRGVIFNRVGGRRHGEILRAAAAPLDLAVLGCLPRAPDVHLPSRHLGLVQAVEHPDLEAFIAAAADLIADHVDVAGLRAQAQPSRLPQNETMAPPLVPLGQRIAVARDAAFAFAYPFIEDGWRAAGAEVATFSPLADEAPDGMADAVILPGGYPELHAGRLAGNGRFLAGVGAAAARGAVVYGECGGYMVLGRGLIDGDGARHAMAGVLPLETSFAKPRLTLGYRQATVHEGGPLGRAGAGFRGHEFHFARVTKAEGGAPLFACRDAGGTETGDAGMRIGACMGSFIHLIDRADGTPPAGLA
ncbi:MAG TPA: cobyrinate a,c-diamide synthase [Kiloniellales bacterium]